MERKDQSLIHGRTRQMNGIAEEEVEEAEKRLMEQTKIESKKAVDEIRWIFNECIKSLEIKSVDIRMI